MKKKLLILLIALTLGVTLQAQTPSLYGYDMAHGALYVRAINGNDVQVETSKADKTFYVSYEEIKQWLPSIEIGRKYDYVFKLPLKQKNPRRPVATVLFWAYEKTESVSIQREILDEYVVRPKPY